MNNKLVCSVDECNSRAKNAKLGLCETHRKSVRMDAYPPCSFLGCDKRMRSLKSGLCDAHYNQKRSGKELRPLYYNSSPPGTNKGPCKFYGCTNSAQAKGYCHGHYKQITEGRFLTILEPRNKQGTWRLNKEGYVVKVVDGKTVRQHRQVMGKHLGRPLRDKENVHHINGMRNDNHINNLELWNTSQPAGQRVKDKFAWCVEFLEEYGCDIRIPDTCDFK